MKKISANERRLARILHDWTNQDDDIGPNETF